MLLSRAPIQTQWMNIGFIGLFGLAILLFGANTPSLAVIYGLVLLFWITVSFLFLGLRKPDRFTYVLFLTWVIFFLASVYKGYVAGEKTQYMLSFLALCVFWCGARGVGHSGATKIIWRLLLLMGFIFSVFALMQHVFTPDQIYFMPKKYHLGRLTGSFISSNTAATLLGIFVVMSIASTLRSWVFEMSYSRQGRRPIPILAIVTFVFSFTALLLTASRAGIAATLISTFVFLGWFLSKVYKSDRYNGLAGRRHLAAFLGAATLGAGLLWYFFGTEAQIRYGSLLDDMDQRFDLATASWNSFQFKPVFGHGLGSFDRVKTLGADETILQNVLLHDTVHNFYLQTLLQTGITGFSAIIIAYGYIVIKILRRVTQNVPHSTFMMTILCISLLICLHGVFDYALEVPALMLLHAWLLGLAYGLSNRSRKRISV